VNVIDHVHTDMVWTSWTTPRHATQTANYNEQYTEDSRWTRQITNKRRSRRRGTARLPPRSREIFQSEFRPIWRGMALHNDSM